MGRRNKGRDISGLLLLDKASGITSNKALQNIKILFDVQKAGHTGSLDPLATGLLPICFGEATKFSQYLLDADKVYLACIKFGESTTTGDAEGEIVEHKPCDFAFDIFSDVLSEFTGALKQVPSMYSALKHHGQPLYKLARQGKEVERQARDIVIQELHLTSDRQLFEQQQIIEVYVHCSKGTYIRNLAEDIGKKTGCGAHLQALRRIRIGHFDTMCTELQLRQIKSEQGLEALDQWIQPIDTALMNFSQLHITAEQAFALKQGKVLSNVEHVFQEGQILRLYQHETMQENEQEFLGLGEVDSTLGIKPKRLLRTN